MGITFDLCLCAHASSLSRKATPARMKDNKLDKRKIFYELSLKNFNECKLLEKLLNWEMWYVNPLNQFFEKMNELEPEKVRGTNRWYFVTPKFRGLYFDITSMFILIGQILRRLNRDFLNIRKPIPKKWTPSDLEDERFFLISLATIDFNSLIVFIGILLEKVARLLRCISVGDRPGPLSFTDWRKDISNGKFLVPSDLEQLMENTLWYNKFDTLRNKFIIHHGYHIGGIINKTAFSLSSHYRDRKTTYDISDIQKLCNDIYHFFENLNKFLCDNFDSYPIRITKSV